MTLRNTWEKLGEQLGVVLDTSSCSLSACRHGRGPSWVREARRVPQRRWRNARVCLQLGKGSRGGGLFMVSPTFCWKEWEDRESNGNRGKEMGKRSKGKEGIKKFSWLVSYFIGYFMQTAYTCYCPVLPTGCRLQAALSSTETRRGIKKCHFHPLKLLQLVSILKFRKNSRTHHRAPEGLGAPSPFVSVRAQSPALAHFLHFTDLSLLEPDYLRFIPFLYLLAAWLWASYLTSLCFICLIRKMGIITVITSELMWGLNE